jgi:DNA mismatch repair protein MutS2
MTASGAAFDDAALAALDFPTVLDRIAAAATSEPGQRAVRSLVPRPDVAAIRLELARVDDAVELLTAGGEIDLGGVEDMAAAIERASVGGVLSGPELRRIAENEVKLEVACAAIARGGAADTNVGRTDPNVGRTTTVRRRTLNVRPTYANGPLLILSKERKPTSPLARRLIDAIEPDGRVADAASAALSKIRRQMRALHDEVRERCQTLVRRSETAKLLSEPIVTVRRGRYVVPVRAEYAAQFPGIVHDQSASGATIFIEPMSIVEANNRLRGLESAEEREVARVLSELSGILGGAAPDLTANADLSAQLDAIGARARWSRSVEGVSPALSPERAIRVVRGRHPLLRRKAVPLDIEVGVDFDALVISGPNMGGKTVMLKTIGLFCLMTYAGIPLPAGAGTVVGMFDHIACVVGDDQSIAENLSSFSAHLRALHAAHSVAGPGSLVLVDEIGSGTEPSAGAAIAQALIESLLERGSRVVVTTHFMQLKTFAAARERVANASMLFDAATNEPTYVLAVGVPGRSLAIPLARSLGFDESTIARAQELLGAEAMDLDRIFAQLAEDRDALRRALDDVESQQARNAEREADLTKRMNEAAAARADFDRRAAEALAQAIEKAAADVRLKAAATEAEARRQRSKPDPHASEALERTLSEMRRSLGLESATQTFDAADSGASTSSNTSFEIGDAVFVRSFNAHGVVADVYERDVLVSIGNAKTIVSRNDLALERRATGPVTSPVSRRKGEDIAAAAERAQTSVDVRGLRVEEATPIVDKALDEASLAGLRELRIIHGRGTGQLRKGLAEFLRDHLQVATTAYAADREGGSGVTVATLR